MTHKMAALLWATTTLLLLQTAHSYILLTANMDDVQAIATQMLSSPMVDQLGKIWRRAATQFNQQLKKPKIQKRAEDDPESDVEDLSGEKRPKSQILNDSFRKRSRRVLGDLSELSRNASDYLEALRRVFQELTKD